jgi:2-keto-4-pentenoate hydratase/2-oxohepta-3-ene-1,7-dioic acid hydratase in catechol pathway
MKVVWYGNPGQERPALVDNDGRLRDVGSIISDINPASLSSPAWQQLCEIKNIDALPDVGSEHDVRLGPCVAGVGKLICMGLNERAHSSEINVSGIKPTIFLKATSSISGPQDAVIFPKVGQKLDWEAELAVVIGTKCKYVSEGEADRFIAGFCILNDLSDRHWQADIRGNLTLVTQAKCFDTFGPIGPYLVTKQEIANPDALQIKLWVNGELRQDSNSRDYIYGVNRAIEFCSQFFTLFPGDVISMGSGPGNAFTWTKYLEIGDRVKASIDGLGTQEYSITAEA